MWMLEINAQDRLPEYYSGVLLDQEIHRVNGAISVVAYVAKVGEEVVGALLPKSLEGRPKFPVFIEEGRVVIRGLEASFRTGVVRSGSASIQAQLITPSKSEVAWYARPQSGD